MEKPYELTLTEVSAAVTAGELRPDDLVQQALGRIARYDKHIKAWSYLDAAGALSEAAALTAEQAAGKLRGPLHGIPIGVKDEFHVKGMPTGMRNRADAPPEPEDATVVARLRQAGAIILGKTYMPIGRRPPPTSNPWNVEHTAGGTSSGSGAAVGARMVPVAVGEQTMGSNLRPAAFCGVAGIKPTYGRISRYGCLPFAWSLDHVGLIGLSFADLALVLSLVAGADERDPTALRDPAPPADLDMDTYRPPRIGLVRNFFLDEVQPSMRAAVEDSAQHLQAAGAIIDDYLLPDDFALTWQAQRILSASEGATYHAQGHERADYTDDAYSGSAGRSGALVPGVYYLQARRIRNWLKRKLQATAFSDYDALLMPTTTGPAPRKPGTGSAQLLIPWSFLGLPAVTVPCGLSPEGLPLGLQLVAGERQDYELLRAGAWCESVVGRLPAPAMEFATE